MEMAHLVNDKNTKDITDREWEPYTMRSTEHLKAWQIVREES